MTDIPITANERKAQFTGNTGLGPFAFVFNVLVEGDLRVLKNNTVLTINTEYTVSLNSDGTGSISLTGSGNGTALISSDILTIIGGRLLARTSDYVQGGNLFAEALNEDLDSIVIMMQQLDEKVSRTMRIDAGDIGENLLLPSKASRLNRVLQFNSITGDPEAGPTAADVANAQTNAANAAASASAAASSASAASGSASAAASSASAAASSESHAASSEAAATAAEAAAIVAKDAAESAATTAQGAATSATSSANAASSSASSAASSASSASSSASAAASSASAAEAARDATLAAYDSFDDRYLGTKTSDPTLDNDGNALVAGALYFNSVDGAMKVYTGSAWVLAYISGGNYLDTAGGTMTGDIDFGDNVKATFGTSEDMWIYHDGGSSYIFDRGTGNLRIITNSTVSIDGASGGEFMAQFVSNGAVTLYFDNSSRLATTADGVDILGTGSLRLPNGTTLQRPSSPAAGDIRWNTTQTEAEIYDGSAWGAVGGAGGGLFKGENGEVGSSAGDIFRINEQTLNTNVTIDSDENASCTGPLAIASGVTLTVTSGGNLSIV